MRKDVKTFLNPAEAEITPQSFDAVISVYANDLTRTAPERYVRQKGVFLCIDSEEKISNYAGSLSLASMRLLGCCRLGAQHDSPVAGAWLADEVQVTGTIDFKDFWHKHRRAILWDAEQRTHLSREEIRLAVQYGIEKDVYTPQPLPYASIKPHMPSRSYQILTGTNGEPLLCHLGRNKKVSVVQCDNSVKRNYFDAIALRDLLLQRLRKPDNIRIAAKLDAAYDSYVKKYGGIHSDDFQTLFRGDSSWSTMLALEEYDEKGFVVGKGKVLNRAGFLSSRAQEPRKYIYFLQQPKAETPEKEKETPLPDSAPGLFLADCAGLPEGSEARDTLEKLFVLDKETGIWDINKDVVNANSDLLNNINFKDALLPIQAGRPRSPVPKSSYDMLLCALNSFYPKYQKRVSVGGTHLKTETNEKAEKELAARIGEIAGNFRNWTQENVKPKVPNIQPARSQPFLDISPGWFSASAHLNDSVLNSACEALYGSSMIPASLPQHDMMLAVVAACIESLQKTHEPSFIISEDEEAPMWNDFIRKTAPNIPIRTIVPAEIAQAKNKSWKQYDGIVILPQSAYDNLIAPYEKGHIVQKTLLRYIEKRLTELRNRVNEKSFVPIVTKLEHLKGSLSEIFKAEQQANTEPFPVNSFVVFTSSDSLNMIAQHFSSEYLFSLEPEGIKARQNYCKLNMPDRLRLKQRQGTTKICFVASEGVKNPAETANTYEEYLKTAQLGVATFDFMPCEQVAPKNVDPIHVEPAMVGITDKETDPLKQQKPPQTEANMVNRLDSMTQHFDPAVLLGYAKQSEIYTESDQMKHTIESGCNFLCRAVKTVIKMKDRAFAPYLPSGEQVFETYIARLEEVKVLFSILSSMGAWYEGTNRSTVAEMIAPMVVKYFSLTVFVELADLKLLVPDKQIISWWPEEKRKKYEKGFSEMYDKFAEFEENKFTFARLFQLSALMKKTMKEEIKKKKDKKGGDNIPIIRRLMSGWTHLQLAQNFIESLLFTDKELNAIKDNRRAGKMLIPDAILKKYKPVYAKLTRPAPRIIPENYSPELYKEMISTAAYDYLIPPEVLAKLKGDELREAELLNTALMDQIDLLFMLFGEQNFFIIYSRGLDFAQSFVENLKNMKQKPSDAEIKKFHVRKLSDLKNTEMLKTPQERIQKLIRTS